MSHRDTTPTAHLRLPLVGAMAAALLCALLVAPRPAAAMTVLKAPLSELVKTSAFVLHGKIKATRVIDRRARGKAVFTEITLEVTEVFKGDARKVGKTFTWELLGGTTADGMTWSIPGMPTFTAGEEVVVLLEKHSTGYTLTGAPQGKFHVFRDAKGIARVHRGLGDVHMVQRAKDGRLVPVHHHRVPLLLQPPRRDKPLSGLRAEIKSYVAAQAKAAKAPTASSPKAVAPQVMKRRALAPRKP